MACCLLLTLLPPELRLYIYKYLLRSEGAVRPKMSLPAEHKSKAAILVTCRQVYDEAYPVLLSINTWMVDPIEDLSWLGEIGVLGQSALRKVIVVRKRDIYCMGPRSPGPYPEQLFNFLSGCRQLKLTISSCYWELLLSYGDGTMKYMHGFAKATCFLSICRKHAHLQWPKDLVNRTSKELREQLISACTEDCKMHVGRPASHTKNAGARGSHQRLPYVLVKIPLERLYICQLGGRKGNVS